MQDSSKSQQRKRGQRNPKPLLNTEVAPLTPKQLTLPQTVQKENINPRNNQRRNRNKKGLTSNANSSNQNDETLKKSSEHELLNQIKGDNKVLDSRSLEENLYVPKQADFSRKQPEKSLKNYEEILYIPKQSNDSEKARRDERRKSKSNANINQVLSKSDSTNLLDNLLVKPSRSEPVNMTDSIFEDLSEKSKEELIAMLIPRLTINRTISQKLTENERNIQSEKKKPNQERRFFVLNEKLIVENETLDYKDYYLSTLLDQENTLNITILLQTACSFLNNRGGRIYLGVRDEECQVKGMYLTKNDRDQIQSLRVLWFKSIYPCALNMITIRFVPVKEEKRFSQIPGLFVVKIVVKPGKPGTLYSTSARKCEYWMRSSCSNLILKPDNVFEIYKQKQLEEAKDTLHAWDDPDLEADLIDMTKIYPLRIKTKEPIEENKLEEFIKQAGISCVIPPQITTKTIIAHFVLDDFKDEVKKYFNSTYSIKKFDDKSPMAAPKTMINLKFSV